jgi:FerI (NUC094) domain/C2 domain
MNKDHELYRMWIGLTDIQDETGGINGFVKISINVLGPGDKPPVHDPSKDLKNKDDNGAPKLFTPGRAKMKSHMVKVCVFRCEHLAPLDLLENTIDPYVKVAFAGKAAQTKVIDNNRNPEFN